MKYLIMLIFMCLAFNSPASVRYSDMSSKESIIFTKALNTKKSPKLEKGTERYLMLAAIYLSAAVGVIFISLLFQPLFLFAIIFLPVFLWSMSSIAALIAQILMLKGLYQRTAVENQSLAGTVFTFMFSRLVLLLLLSLLADPILALLFLVMLFPGFIFQITVIAKLQTARR